MSPAGIQALAALLVAILGPAGFVGLVVWLVKNASNRQAAITDRYFAFLESHQAASTKAIDQLVAANQAHAEANSRLAASIEHQNADIQKIAQGVQSVVQFQANDHRSCLYSPQGGVQPA